MKASVKRRATFDAPLAAWFAGQGWTPAPFQRAAWRHYLAGRDGLLVTPTGSGKTLAAFGGPLLQALRDPPPPKRKRGELEAARTRVLWITPLRALANDTTRALRTPIEALGLPWTVAMRTGDASSRDKRLARNGQSDVLVITPESLALLLSYPETSAQLQGLRSIVVDEWHELLGSKRGVLLQLCLARVRAVAPGVRTWGLSATLGNLPEARDALLPHSPDAPIIDAAKPRSLTLETLLPEAGERFPWAGHLGLSQLQRVVDRVQDVRSTLLFANTRSQAELWHKALQSVWLDDPATLAPAPRFHRPEAPAGRRTRPARRQRPLRGGDLQPRPRRGFPGRRPGHPDRQPEGHGAPAATRRACTPSPRRSWPHSLRADACA